MLRTKITIASILTLIYFLGLPAQVYGVSSHSQWWAHFTYPLLHGNIVHLICNIYALWFCLNERTYPKQTLLPLLYIIAVVSSFLYTSDQPTIGFSGVIFAMIGINLVRVPTRVNIIYMVIILAAGILIPQIAGVNHLISFAIGCAVAMLTGHVKRFKHDYF